MSIGKRERTNIARALITGASKGRSKYELLGLEPPYGRIVCMLQVGGVRLDEQVPPPCIVVSGVTQVDDSVTTICSSVL